jgi:hypothetical protein
MPQNCHGILYLPSVSLKLEDLPIHGIQDHLIHVLGLPTIPCGLSLSLDTTSLRGSLLACVTPIEKCGNFINIHDSEGISSTMREIVNSLFLSYKNMVNTILIREIVLRTLL